MQGTAGEDRTLDPARPVERVTLRGRRILLEPLHEKHLPGLELAVADGELWAIPVTFVPRPEQLPDFLADARAQYEAQLERQFAVIELGGGTVVGSTRFMNISRINGRVEIGFTFLARSWQRTHVNTEAKYLMLSHAFDVWGCNRVEFLTHALNTQSRRAILRIGASEEGVLRDHMIMRDGRLRDSVIHSILRTEWPAVRRTLEQRMADG